MAIKIKNLSYSRNGIPLLENINFIIEKKETGVIKGESGKGKTTLLNIINGLIPPKIGLITCGDEIFNSDSIFLPPEKRNIGYVFQDFALFPHLNSETNVLFASKNKDRTLFNEVIQDLASFDDANTLLQWLLRVGLVAYDANAAVVPIVSDDTCASAYSPQLPW